jgi:hypothetical protein
MAHISSLGAGLYSTLSVGLKTTDWAVSDFPTTNAATWNAFFATEIGSNGTAAANSFIRIQNIREFPALGTPANIVQVPSYGQKTTSQIQGQADAPTLEIQLNFIGSDWASDTTLGALVGNGKVYPFRFALLNAVPTNTNTQIQYASTATGVGSVQNSMWYWYGKLEALQVNPQLTDANTATLTLSAQGEFRGAFTI